MKKKIIIVGGGLAGLISAIHLAKSGVFVTLVEKDSYPKHKVCGEYISNEVLPYFKFLELDMEQLGAVSISKVQISTHNGKNIKSNLPLGGFGISRFALDHYLWGIASKLGVHLINDQVLNISKSNNKFEVETSKNGNIEGDFVIGAYGKRSVLDKNLNRSFHQGASPWLAVKAHYKASFETDLVALHNFDGGYCGLSTVENNKVNACYLVNYKSFKRYKDIHTFQTEILYQNHYLKGFFERATPIFDKSITISQINFKKKKPVENHIFMIGDAAGLIHPLCGNGMAMAIQGAKIVSDLFIKYADQEISREKLEILYTQYWETTFSKRLYAGRILQKVLLNSNFQNIAQKAARIFPTVVPAIIKQTHGKEIVCP